MTMALATAKKMVKESGPLLRTLFETLMVAIQGKIRTWIRGKPTSRSIAAANTAIMADKAEDAALRPLAQVEGWQARHDEQAAQQHDDRGRIVHPAGDRLSGTALRTQQVARRDYHRPNEEHHGRNPVKSRLGHFATISLHSDLHLSPVDAYVPIAILRC